MIAAERRDRTTGRLLAMEPDGDPRDRPRGDLARLLRGGDLVVANDAAVLPASLSGTHQPTGAVIEIRLAAWVDAWDPTRFIALAFGAGDHRMRTEDRPAPPSLSAGDRLRLGPLTAVIERTLDHPRLVRLRFPGGPANALAGIARHGRSIQYAHVPDPVAPWDVWISVAALPVAFEAPSAGFALDWRTLAEWRSRGVGFATLTHAAGVSSTGDPALDARLPFDEPYFIPERTAGAVRRVRAAGGDVVAIGTTVVRALESAAGADGAVQPGAGVATGRIGPGTELRAVDAILTGVHEPGESHYELLRAFAGDATLRRMLAAAERSGYRGHEFGDSLLIRRERARPAAAS